MRAIGIGIAVGLALVIGVIVANWTVLDLAAPARVVAPPTKVQ